MKNLSSPVKITGLALSLLFIFFQSVMAADLLIVEAQIYGESTSDDFVKLYNPTTSDIYLGSYQDSYIRLVKRTKTGTKDVSIKSWSKDADAVIPAGGFYIWANNNYASVVQADASTSQTIAANNGIALRLGPENTGLIIDAVGWGDFNNALFEGSPFPENPGPGQQLKRKAVSSIYQDTNNNSQDFYLYPVSKPEPEPQPAQSGQELPIETKAETAPPQETPTTTISSLPIPSSPEPSADTTQAAPKTHEPAKIDLNAASLKELEKLTGIGPALAQRIIDARPFYSVDDLTKVSGIGPKTLADIKSQDLAWVDPALQPAKPESQAGSAEKGAATVAQPISPQYAKQQTKKPLFVLLIALVAALFFATVIFALKKKSKFTNTS